MMVDDILVRKEELLAQRREEEARAEPDNFTLFFLNEEIADLNAQLRTLRGAVRSLGATTSGFSMDAAAYQTWTRAVREDEAERDAHSVYVETMKDSADVLTQRQQEMLDAWQDGTSVTKLAERFGVDKSTVSRTISRCKARLRAEAETRGRRQKLEGLVVFDLSDRGVAKVILSCLTAHQAVCMYLYYGEWLSLRDCGELLDVDHAAVLRAVQRGLRAIQDTLRCGAFTLDNVDALAELAYELYVEDEISPALARPPLSGEARRATGKRGKARWARRSIGYQPKKPTVSVTVRRSDGQTRGTKGGMAPRSMSRLMRLLFEKRLSGRTLLDKLKRLFRKLTKTGGNEP